MFLAVRTIGLIPKYESCFIYIIYNTSFYLVILAISLVTKKLKKKTKQKRENSGIKLFISDYLRFI